MRDRSLLTSRTYFNHFGSTAAGVEAAGVHDKQTFMCGAVLLSAKFCGQDAVMLLTESVLARKQFWCAVGR
jgi:hypothetical protein